jgi:uncharacterized protein (DUF1778 family)
MKKQPKQPLTKTATIRFTEEELRWIEDAASLHYHSRGEFIREALWIFRNEFCASSLEE